MAPTSLRERIAEIPFLDQHTHAPLRQPQAIAPEILRAVMTESVDDEVRRNQTPRTIAYTAMIRWLAALLGTEPAEEEVLAERARRDPAGYHRLLADDANLGALLDDHLMQPGMYEPAEWAELTGRPVYTLLRVEAVAQELIPGASSWERLRRDFQDRLAGSVTQGGVGFKSIAAYRTGLEVVPVDAAEAEQALGRVQARFLETGVHRLADKTLVDALIWETMEVAAELSVPLQFHVGLGDDDVYLPSSDPALLRHLFQEPRYRHVPIVLLHNYPFVEQAAYLASIYPNAYVDLGLTVPLAGSDCARQIATAIGTAPLTKVLASTDGHGVPEFQWFAARLWRVALPQALQPALEANLLTDHEALDAARLILHDNAWGLYKLES